MSVTNRDIFDELKELRLEMKHDLSELRDEVGINTAFRNNLSGKMAVGVITIGAFISMITAIVTSYINNKLFRK